MKIRLSGSFVDTFIKFAVVTETPLTNEVNGLKSWKKYKYLNSIFRVGQILILSCHEDDTDATWGRTIADQIDPHKIGCQIKAFDTILEAVDFANTLGDIIKFDNAPDIKWAIENDYLKPETVDWGAMIEAQAHDLLIICAWCEAFRLPFCSVWIQKEEPGNAKSYNFVNFQGKISICPECLRKLQT